MAIQRPGHPFEQLTFFPSARWIRGLLGDSTIVDSTRAVLVWEPGRPVPVYAFPHEDVDAERLVPSTPSAAAATAHAAASAWHALRTDGTALPDAAWSYADAELSGHVALAWKALDHWYEEDEEIFVHPRDPFHRVDAIASSRHVRVELEGRAIAESARPVLVFETGLRTRYYLPREDVDAAVLGDSATHTACPYKGIASYHDVIVGEHTHRNLFWYYPDPLAAVAQIAGRLAPYDERADFIVDAGPPRRG
jgi:uncharacterized protein (DUF427 family)